MSTPAASIHDLLVHGEFLRRLVRDLVADEAAQLDLTQQVWLQALRSPPRDARSLRGWLATTARNLLVNARRSEARREMREFAAAEREPAPAADEILARESVRESVIRAVLALDEPFREAVILRYYEGLTPREIAARLGVPQATVRTRVARGLERLRGRLQENHGDRGAWALAVLPLARAPVAPLAFAGVIAVKKLAVLVALIALTFLAWRFVATDRADSRIARHDAEAVNTTGPADRRAAEPVLSAAALESQRAAASVAAPPAPSARRVYPARRGLGSIHGVVLDAFDAPLAGAIVRAWPHQGGTAPGLALDDDRSRVPEVETDASGRFRLDEVDEGPVRVEATFPAGSTAERVIVLGADEDAGPLRFAVEDARSPAPALEVLVVDARGAPVADADVEVFGWSRGDRDPVLVDAHATRPAARGTSGADGRVVLDGRTLAIGTVIARSNDGRAGWCSFRDNAFRGIPSPLRIEIAPTGSLAGVIQGASDEELHGARLSLHALSTLEPYHTAAGHRLDFVMQGARFDARDLPSGTYAITLDAPAGARLVHPRMPLGQRELENSITPITAVVEPGRASRIELVAAHGARLRGRVTAHGAPIAGARVRVVLAPRTSNFPAGFVLHGVHVWRFDGQHEQAPNSPVSHRVVRTDAEGRYDFTGLAPGRWRVEVASDGLTLDRRLDVELADESTVELEHALVEAGVLQVGTLATSYLGVFPGDAQDPVMIAVVRDGCATFAGLAPGRYRVADVHSDEAQPHVFLGEALVEAGRTTWVDLRAEGRVRVHGIVRLDGAPLAGATVGVYPATVITDPAGRYEIRRTRSPHFGAGFGASITVNHAGIEHVFTPSDETAGVDRSIDLDLVSGSLIVEVVDAEGRAIPARIDATWTPTTRAPNGPRESRARHGSRDGRFELAPLGPGQVAGAVTFGDGWSAQFESTVPRSGPLRIERPPAGKLTVRALRAGGPVEDLTVFLALTTDGASSTRWRHRVVTDARGLIVLDAPAGEITAESRAGFLEPGATGSARIEPGAAAEIVLQIDG